MEGEGERKDLRDEKRETPHKERGPCNETTEESRPRPRQAKRDHKERLARNYTRLHQEKLHQKKREGDEE